MLHAPRPEAVIGAEVPAATILEAVQQRRDELIRLTSDLIRFRTVRLTGEGFEACALYLRDELVRAGLDAAVGHVPDEEVREVARDGSHYRWLGLREDPVPRPFVLASASGSGGGRSLHLNGHFCVVEPPDGWTGDPFEPRLIDGRIVGRGAIDMKGGLAMIVVAVRAARELAGRLAGDVHVSATVDTHFGGDLGAGWIARQGLGRSDAVVVADTSGPDRLLLGYRGQLWVEIVTTGRATHGSTPVHGRNAVEDMAIVIARLRQDRQELESTISAYPIAPEASRRPSLTIGSTIAGGSVMNTVPARCRLTLDRRLIPEETAEEAMAGIEAAVQRARDDAPGMEVETRLLFSAPPTVTAEDDPLVRAFTESIREIVGRPARTLVHPAFLDLQWFTHAWGVPGVVYGPGDGGAATQFERKPYTEPDEALPVEDLVRATAVLTSAILRATARSD